MPAKRPDIIAAVGARSAGNGVASLFADTTAPGVKAKYPVRELPIEKVHTNNKQARQAFDAEGLSDLAASIKEYGVLEPIIVRAHPDRVGEFVVVAGERRRRAAGIAELETIPAIIRDDLSEEDASIVTALENLQREDLDLEDEARYFAQLIEATGYTERRLAESLGKSKDYVNRRLRLLREQPELFQHIRTGGITQREALNMVVRSGSTVAVAADNPPLMERSELDQIAPSTTADSSVSHGATLSSNGQAASQPVLSTTANSSVSHRATDSGHQPWRRRPLDTFQTWWRNTDIRMVPRQERSTVRQQIADLRQELAQAERLLEEMDAEERDSGIAT